MIIKQCRVCGADFDCKGAANAKTCPKHRLTASKAQAMYHERMKQCHRCSWCGNYTTKDNEFCKPECETDALRYRAHLKREEEKINALKINQLDSKVA